MKRNLYLVIIYLIPFLGGGCVWTSRREEMIVRKDANGNIIGVDNVEILEQRDLKPWGKTWGRYLYNPELNRGAATQKEQKKQY